MTDFVPTLIGFAAGLLVGSKSTGGGAVLTPALILIARVPPSIAIGSDALIARGMKLIGGGFYALRRQVHWPTVARLGAGSIPGAMVGVAILNRMPLERLEMWRTHAPGIVLVAAGGRSCCVWFRASGDRRGECWPPRSRCAADSPSGCW